MNNPNDIKAAALCIWREARGEGYRGMTAVGCVIRNRSMKRNESLWQVVYAPYQFSSMDPGDPQAHVQPKFGDPQYSQALDIANDIAASNLTDITGSATLYYDSSISFPASWDRSKVVATVQIGRLHFFREL